VLTGKKRLRPQQTETLLKLYEVAVEMADRVSQRRQTANSYYLSINTALVGGAAFLSQTSTAHSPWMLGVAGVCVCLLWMRSISSYRTLNDAKFKVIHEIELNLPAQPYTEEWSHLDPGRTGRRHNAFHETERLVPVVFILIHTAQAAFTAPWSWLWTAALSMTGALRAAVR
jgi:hypothetical protein